MKFNLSIPLLAVLALFLSFPLIASDPYPSAPFSEVLYSVDSEAPSLAPLVIEDSANYQYPIPINCFTDADVTDQSETNYGIIAYERLRHEREYQRSKGFLIHYKHHVFPHLHYSNDDVIVPFRFQTVISLE